MTTQSNSQTIRQEAKEERKSQLRLQIRTEILQACAQLIVEKGLSKLSMDEISTLSGFSKGSLYNYFGNRDELIWVVINTYREHFLSQCMPVLRNSELKISERLHFFVDILFDSLESQHGLSAVLEYFQEQVSAARHIHSSEHSAATARMMLYIDAFHENFTPFFTEGIQAGIIRGQDAKICVFSLINLVTQLYDASKTGLINDYVENKNSKKFVIDLFLIDPLSSTF